MISKKYFTNVLPWLSKKCSDIQIHILRNATVTFNSESSIEVFLVTVDFIILRMKSSTHSAQEKCFQHFVKCSNIEIFCEFSLVEKRNKIKFAHLPISPWDIYVTDALRSIKSFIYSRHAHLLRVMGNLLMVFFLCCQKPTILACIHMYKHLQDFRLNLLHIEEFFVDFWSE